MVGERVQRSVTSASMAAKTATLPTISRTACSGDTAAAGAAAGAGNCAGVVTGTWEAGSGGSAIAMWQDFRGQLSRRQQTSLISQAAATPILRGCGAKTATAGGRPARSEEHTSELQSLMRISYAVFCLKKKKRNKLHTKRTTTS